MIHLLEIGPEITASQARKTARRLAMTGGFEIGLREGLSEPELTLIIERFAPELEAFDANAAQRRSSTAFRILQAAAARSASAANREKLKQLGVL